MLMILTTKEMDWLAEIRNCHLAEREGFRLYDQGALSGKALIEKLKKNFEETDRILSSLKKRGL